MVGKNNKRLLDQKANQRFTKWSLRRLNIGVVSVAIASGFVMAGGLEIASIAKADTMDSVTTEMQALATGSETAATETSGTARAEEDDEAVMPMTETADQAAPLSTMPNADHDAIQPVRAAVAQKMSDKFEPETQNTNALQGQKLDDMDAMDAVVNAGEFPPETKYSWQEAVDTWTPGEKAGFVVITYPDGSQDVEGLTVKVNAGEAGKNPLKTSVAVVEINDDVDPKIGIQNLDALPEDATVAWEEKVDTSKPGAKEGHIIVTYNDGSKARLTVTVNVKEDEANMHTPQGHKVIVEQNGTIPPKSAIANADELPADTKYSWKNMVDTSKPGDYKGTVVVTYSDKTTDEVTVDIQVNPAKKETLADKYIPQPTPVSVRQDEKVAADQLIGNKNGLPNDTEYTFEKEPNTTNPGAIDVKIIVKYSDGSTETVASQVLVIPGDASSYEPVGQDITVEQGQAAQAENGIKNKGQLPDKTTYKFEGDVDTAQPGSQKATIVVIFPDKSEKKVTVNVIVNKKKTLAEQHNPTAKPITGKQGELVDPKEGIRTPSALPNGTRFEYTAQPDITTVDHALVTIKVIYTDGTFDLVPTMYTVTANPDFAVKPAGQDLEITQGDAIKPEDAIMNKDKLPNDVTYTFENPVDVNKPGEQQATVIVANKTGYNEKVMVKVTVKKKVTLADQNEPKGQNLVVKLGEKPEAKTAITNFKELPKDTTAEWEKTLETATPGTKAVNILVKYTDGSQDVVTVQVEAKESNAEAFPPLGKNITVKKGETLEAKAVIENHVILPEDTKYIWEQTPNTNQVGQQQGTVLVSYPDGSKESVTVTVTVIEEVKKLAEQYNPLAKPITVEQGATPNAMDGIRIPTELPNGTRFEFAQPVNTNEVGQQLVFISVIYSDGSVDTVKTGMEVTPKQHKESLADKHEPKGQDLVVKLGEKPEAKTAITNFTTLPNGTTAEWEKPLETATPGTKAMNILVKYTDGSHDVVTVQVEAKETNAEAYPPLGQDLTVKKGEKPAAKSAIQNHVILPKDTQYTWKQEPNTSQAGQQQATVLVRYPDGSEAEVPVKVTVVSLQADENEPKGQGITTHTNEKPEAKSAIENAGQLPTGTAFTWAELDTTTPGKKIATVTVQYTDGSSDTVEVEVTVKAWDKDTYSVLQNDLTVKKGEEAKAEDAVLNREDLPQETKYSWVSAVDTGKAGNQRAEVLVTYPDGSEFKFEVLVRVIETEEQDKDKYQVLQNDLTVKKGEEAKAEDAVLNREDLPQETKYSWVSAVDTSKAGNQHAEVLVTYPDGSEFKFDILVRVIDDQMDQKTQAEENEPKGKNLTVSVGDQPEAKDAIMNATDLPQGTTFAWKEMPNTAKPGDQMATVIVTYADKSTDTVDVTVRVAGTQADEFDPQGKDLTVTVGDKVDAKNAIATDLPEGTTFKWEKAVNTYTPGEQMATVIVTYPDQSTDKVTVKVIVNKKQTMADQQNPQGQKITVKQGEVVNAKDGIVAVEKLPANTKISWKAMIDTAKPGTYMGTIVLTYVDGSMDEVMVTVEVVKPMTMADEHTPMAQKITVTQGEMANAEAGIQNLKDLPQGTKVTWYAAVDTHAIGTFEGKVVVTYTDGSEDIVPVMVEVVAKAAPDQPIVPEQPDKPMDPEQPDKPMDPEQPDKPMGPEQPDKPMGPEMPGKPMDSKDPQGQMMPQGQMKAPAKSASDQKKAEKAAERQLPQTGASDNFALTSGVLLAAMGLFALNGKKRKQH